MKIYENDHMDYKLVYHTLWTLQGQEYFNGNSENVAVMLSCQLMIAYFIDMEYIRYNCELNCGSNDTQDA